MFSSLLNEMYQEFGKVWQCSERYKVKGVMGYANRQVEEETLIKACLMAWNALVEN